MVQYLAGDPFKKGGWNKSCMTGTETNFIASVHLASLFSRHGFPQERSF